MQLFRMGGIGIVFALVLGGLWFFQARDRWDALSWEGMPHAQVWYDWHTLNRPLTNHGYLVGWSDLRGNPLWVTYRLHRVKNPDSDPRPRGFRSDWRSLWPIDSDDYTRSGYDRGHMAPNYAMSVVHGRQAQLDTFLMTNVSPQRPDLNRKAWQRLEEVVIDHFVRRFGTVWVTTGPIFDSRITRMASLIEVPDAFYKILIVPGSVGNPPKALAFILPQTVKGNEPLDRFVVSIDEVERRTGLDFFSDLPDAIEVPLEGSVNPGPWHLDSVARTPSRY
ncbi:DNA/RNA non-specific endonuclease [Larsenimonas rhizosphaerae]|uniref:DNA/RNA non-specific endonuclease n=1 Tax=Larsenimonas rhizosphaerae TaxID=2944682 RepID=A0AA41ZJB9_9GAMM|nr:DNA/RNA non-specific endonuclease [Larsenimonas rhizosphaerae]MCM2130149.1 DNA/RNA non-specific endonuclease [Larsenimonas rhizosphaerae]MCX2522836.1 DNA/RNA non-specific endonuclease [Larsenimonas rhizosphaerae]